MEGDDLVRARDGRFDYLTCWEGRDTAILDRFDLYERDCERVRRRGAARSVLYGTVVYLKRLGHPHNELEIDFTCPYDGPAVCNPTFLVHSHKRLVLRGDGPTRQLGDQGWVWGMAPRVLGGLTTWVRVTMRATDAHGHRYRQTLTCPSGAVEVELPEPDSFHGTTQPQSAPTPRAKPLAGRHDCSPPVRSLDPSEQ